MKAVPGATEATEAIVRTDLTRKSHIDPTETAETTEIIATETDQGAENDDGDVGTDLVIDTEDAKEVTEATRTKTWVIEVIEEDEEKEKVDIRSKLTLKTKEIQFPRLLPVLQANGSFLILILRTISMLLTRREPMI